MIPLGIVSAAGAGAVALPILSSNISIYQYGYYDFYDPINETTGQSGFNLTDQGYISIERSVNKIYPITYVISLTGTPLLGDPISQPLANKPVMITFSVNGISAAPIGMNTDEYGEIVISNNLTLQGSSPQQPSWNVNIDVSFNGESSPQEIYSSGRGLYNTFYTDEPGGQS